MDQRVLDYIKDGMKQGYSVDSLKQALVQQGWNPADVAQAVNYVQSYAPPAPQASPETPRSRANIKKRGVVFVFLASILTLGIYAIYWIVKTKGEINSLGADIPTAWLMIVPIANLYFFYKYCEGFSSYVKNDNNTILWFLLYVFVGPVAMIIIQMELNKLAT